MAHERRRGKNRASDRVAPAFNTGGGGFTYEDLVGAWAAAALLSGAAPLGLEVGPLGEIRFQTQSLDRTLDDLLLAGEEIGGRRWSASIKSFDMLAAAELAPDFVRAAWHELLEGPFERNWDFIGFVCGRATEANWKALQKLIAAARSDESGLPDRIDVKGAFSREARSIWKSCRCPDELAGRHELDRESSPSRLLAALIPRRLDLLDPGSLSIAEAQRWCQEALVPQQSDRSEDLWEAVCTAVSEVSTSGGAITWPSLLRRFRGRFDFRLRPDVEPDWVLLQRSTEEALEAVRDQIGDGIHLPREGAWAELTAAGDALVVALSGPSGCGKTALAKRWLNEAGQLSLWLSSSDLDGGFAGVRARLGLRRTLAEILTLAPGEVRVVIDGLDRCYELENFSAAASLATLAAESEGRIRLLFTSQQMELPRVGGQITEANGPRFEIVAIDDLQQSDVQLVLQAEPELAKIAVSGQLHSVLRRPKLLDLLLRASRGSEQLLSQVSDESGVANLWWQHLALRGPNSAVRQELLLKLAIGQADTLSTSTPGGQLPPADVASTDELRRDGILDDSDSRYQFSHDLFVDWTLLQRLRGLGEDTVEELGAKSELPSWHRAIRLYALEILREGGVDAWSAQRQVFEEADQRLLGDLFLDAALFAQDAGAQLQALWPALVEEEGGLLRRLLRRFRYVATVPDPSGKALFPDSPDLEAHWAIQRRVPLWPLWIPVLELICENRTVAIELATEEVAVVTETWLRWACPDTVLCERTAEVAIAIGRYLLEQGRAGTIFEEDLERSLWSCVAAAGGVDPAAVSDLILPALREEEGLP